jgi:uncharacterized protein YkwD
MWRTSAASDAQGMGKQTPARFLVAAALCCSLGALTLSRWPGARAEGPAPQASAEVANAVVGAATPTPVVTEATPPAQETPPAPPTPSALVAAATSAAPVAPIAAVPATIATVAAPAIESREKAAALVDLMNEARRKDGLGPLVPDTGLVEVAGIRARNLVANGYFDHYGPDGSSAFSELAVHGIRYRLAGENLARNNYPENRTVQSAFDGLMASPGHRANILEPRFASVGVVAIQANRVWVYITIFTNEQ